MSKPRPARVDILVRSARQNDRDLMADWAVAMALESEVKHLPLDMVTRGIQAGLDDPARANYFIAEIAGEPAGTVMLTPEWSDWRDGWWWWIQSVYVPPAHRRKGVFRALFEHVRNKAAATDGVRGLRLYVERENAGAQRTYEFVGMKDAGYRMYEIEFPQAKSD
jgi:GNAT superfamily N-acetyltransferase